MQTGNASIPQKAFYIASALALFLAGLIAYANTLDGEWVWDDASSVLRNEHVQNPRMLPQLFREDQHPFGEGQGNFYRPLVAVTFLIDFLFSYNPQQDDPSTPYADVPPFLFHLRNIGIHCVASILLFFLLLRMHAPRWAAFCAALLFVVHPLHTEAVAYVSGRADMMSAVFMFFGLWLAVSMSNSWTRYLAWAFSPVCFIAALLSKESSLIFPVLLALLIFLPPRSEGEEDYAAPSRLLRAAPLLAALLIVGAYIRLRATVLNFTEEQAAEAAPFLQRVMQTGQAFAFYVQKLFLPAGLHMEQSLAGVPAWTSLVGWLLIAVFIGLLVATRLLGHHRISLGLAWFLAAWLPISGLFPLNAPMAEHWMYVPMAGFWWAVCEALWLLAQAQPIMRPALSGTVFLLALLFLYVTAAQNQVWHSNERLFRSTLAQNPDSMRVQFNLAVTYEDLMGNTAGARRYFENMLTMYEAQKQDNPINGSSNYLLDNEVEVRMSLARLYLAQGYVSEAASQYSVLANALTDQKWAQVRAQATLGLSRALLALGDFASAGQVLSQAVQMEPALEPQLRALILEGAPPVPML